MDKNKIINTINEYQDKVAFNLSMQKELKIKEEHMIIPYDEFAINGSLEEGNEMFRSVAKVGCSLFDETCKNIENNIKISNIDNSIEKIKQCYNKINKNLSPFEVRISSQYLELKISNCKNKWNILFAKSQLKEIERSEKEIIKEQLKEEKQIQRELDKLERQKNDLQYKFNQKLKDTQIYDDNIKRDIDNIENSINKNKYALTHKRSGYVYVVSNSDMKEGQYKIGITRRSVEDRMKELGSGASHSFGMNVHGYVYCDDCFEVESKLHRYFAERRVNQVNPRKEWFKTTLPEIKQAFWDLFNINIMLTEVDDENYLYSKGVIDI